MSHLYCILSYNVRGDGALGWVVTRRLTSLDLTVISTTHVVQVFRLYQDREAKLRDQTLKAKEEVFAEAQRHRSHVRSRAVRAELTVAEGSGYRRGRCPGQATRTR